MLDIFDARITGTHKTIGIKSVEWRQRFSPTEVFYLANRSSVAKIGRLFLRKPQWIRFKTHPDFGAVKRCSSDGSGFPRERSRGGSANTFESIRFKNKQYHWNKFQNQIRHESIGGYLLLSFDRIFREIPIKSDSSVGRIDLCRYNCAHARFRPWTVLQWIIFIFYIDMSGQWRFFFYFNTRVLRIKNVENLCCKRFFNSQQYEQCTRRLRATTICLFLTRPVWTYTS